MKYSSQIILTFLILLISNIIRAQFNFPSTQLIKDKGVRSIKVYNSLIGYEGGDEKERKSFEVDSTRRLEKIFYFNECGRADSIIFYPNTNGFHEKYVYTYDDCSIIGTQVINNKGLVTHETKLSKTSNGFQTELFQHGKLKSRTKFNKDSILIESKSFAYEDTTNYSLITYDPETNLRVESWDMTSPRFAFKQETFQWFTTDNEPSHFRYTLSERTWTNGRITTKEKEFKLDEEGNVVNKYLGRFDDPFIAYNYYDRFDKFTSIQFGEENRFQSNELTKSYEITSLYTFSGIFAVYRYDLEYDYGK